MLSDLIIDFQGEKVQGLTWLVIQCLDKAQSIAYIYEIEQFIKWTKRIDKPITYSHYYKVRGIDKEKNVSIISYKIKLLSMFVHIPFFFLNKGHLVVYL